MYSDTRIRTSWQKQNPRGELSSPLFNHLNIPGEGISKIVQDYTQ
jgi:hypothetical protein